MGSSYSTSTSRHLRKNDILGSNDCCLDLVFLVPETLFCAFLEVAVLGCGKPDLVEVAKGFAG